MYIYYNISLNSFYNENLFRRKCRDSQNIHFMFSNTFSNIPYFLWNRVTKSDRPYTTLWHVLIVRYTNTNSECVIISAFQQHLGETKAPQCWFILFVILTIWRENMQSVYLCHRSGGLSRGFASAFDRATFCDLRFKPFYCHPHYVTYVSLLRAYKMWSLINL